eukprot:660454-Hanusia_phi.AAC.2
MTCKLFVAAGVQQGGERSPALQVVQTVTDEVRALQKARQVELRSRPGRREPGVKCRVATAGEEVEEESEGQGPALPAWVPAARLLVEADKVPDRQVEQQLATRVQQRLELPRAEEEKTCGAGAGTDLKVARDDAVSLLPAADGLEEVELEVREELQAARVEATPKDPVAHCVCFLSAFLRSPRQEEEAEEGV